MLLKAILAAVVVLAVIITLGLLGTQSDTNIAETSEQLVEWYREIIT